MLQFTLNGGSTAQVSDLLPQRSQYSDYILEGQLSHKYQVDHRPEKEQITLFENKHVIPLHYLYSLHAPVSICKTLSTYLLQNLLYSHTNVLQDDQLLIRRYNIV